MIYIKNARVITPEGITENGAILLDGEKIAAVGTADTVKTPVDADVVDAQGLYVGPGFVDIHVHGGGSWMFDAVPAEAAAHFLSHGETTVFPTLYYNLDKEAFLAAIDRVKAAKAQAGNIHSIYMEGPYMNPKYGAAAQQNKWQGPIREEDYRELVDRAGEDAGVWAIAPEREGLAPFMEYAKSVNPKVVFAVGHSEATPEQIQDLPYPITIQTHCMNATGRVNEGGGVRGTGPDEACLLDDNMYAELISDSMAIHVNPSIQKLILKVKGINKIVLISDSFVSMTDNPPAYSHIKDLSFDLQGSLCGSKLTMDAAVRNFMKHTGCSLCDAFLAASTNPAKAVGIEDEVGSIAVGKLANLVFVDENCNINKIYLKGTLV